MKRAWMAAMAAGLWLLAGPACAQDAPQGAAAVVVSLLSSARVHAPQIELGEVATITGADPETLERLGTVDLGRAPWPGYARTIEADAVRRALVLAQFDEGQVVLEGSGAVSVETLSVVVPGEKLVGLAQDYIMQHMSWPPQDVIMEFTRFPRSLRVPEGKELDFSITCASPNNAYIGEVQLNLGVKVDGQIYQTIPVTIRVRVFKDVVVTRTRIACRDRLSPDNVTLERREITFASGQLVSDMDYACRQRARMVIAPNTIVRETMIDEPPAVVKGKDVTVSYSQGGLSVLTHGVACENGKVGDKIRVQNPVTKKFYSATVQSADAVTLNL